MVYRSPRNLSVSRIASAQTLLLERFLLWNIGLGEFNNLEEIKIKLYALYCLKVFAGLNLVEGQWSGVDYRTIQNLITVRAFEELHQVEHPVISKMS